MGGGSGLGGWRGIMAKGSTGLVGEGRGGSRRTGDGSYTQLHILSLSSYPQQL